MLSISTLIFITLLYTMRRWNITDDFMKDIEKSLEMFVLAKRNLSLTLLQLLRKDPFKIFIPVLSAWNTVGNLEVCNKIMFREKEVNLFLMSLTDATIQDGSTGESWLMIVTLTLSLK